MTVPYTFGTATTSIPLSNLDANFNTPITLGNTSIYLGNTTTTIGNLTLTNVTISSGTANITSNITYATANAVVFTNSSSIGTTNANLTWNGTNLGVTGTLSTSGVATFSAGTAALPAITTTGDTNTGIYFPAADTIAFTEGGVESMRIDSSGNVGIGTSSPTAKLEVVGVEAIRAVNDIAYISFYNSANTTRSGYLQMTSSGASTLSVDVAQPLTFQTTGTERMRITSAGNVGIGTSSPTAIGNFTSLTTNGTTGVLLDALVGGTIVSRLDSRSGEVALNSYGTLAFGTGSGSTAERMRIDSSGNLGLGVTPSAWGTAYRTAVQVGAGACFAGTSGGSASDYFTIGGNFYLNSSASYRYISTTTANRLEASAGEFRFYNAPSGTAGTAITFTQAMTLDASGNLLVGTTTVGGVGGLTIDPAYDTNRAGVIWNTDSTSNGVAAAFRYNATQVGYISYTNTTVTYNTGSDYRLKENIAPMTGALNKVSQLKPVVYTWKDGGNYGEGFIAHELQSVIPLAVDGEKDAVDAEGNPKYQGIDYSKIVATLTAAIQELKAEFDAYKATHP